MDDKERRRHMNGLRSAASYLNHLDSDDFPDGAVHGETAVRWAVEEIERLDRENAELRCERDQAMTEAGWVDPTTLEVLAPEQVDRDWSCGHDHTRSPLELPKGNTARTQQQRVMVMRQSWPTVTTDANGVVHFHDAYRIIDTNQGESP